MSALKRNTIPTNDVGLIVVQFRLTPDEWVKLLSLKNILPAGEGKRENGPHKKGRKFLPPTENVIVFSCNEDLFMYYKLADAFHDETPEGHHLAQFVFVKGKNAKISDEFKKIGLQCLFAFNTLRKKHLWRTPGVYKPRQVCRYKYGGNQLPSAQFTRMTGSSHFGKKIARCTLSAVKSVSSKNVA